LNDTIVAPIQTIQVANHSERSYATYSESLEPYGPQDTLEQKLWAVVNHELGPNAADILAKKLHRAVSHHIDKAGQRR
jgi:hypothetical protein